MVFVVDAGLVDSWNNLREILDERWLGDLSHKFAEEILRLYIFRNVYTKQLKYTIPQLYLIFENDQFFFTRSKTLIFYIVQTT